MNLLYPQKLYVETTTRCNLNCAKCVKYAHGSDIQEADMDMATFAKLLPDLAPIQSLILNGIGEPLLHPLLPEFIRLARKNMPERGTIGFQSNGMLLTPGLADKLLQAGLDTICLSVDTLAPSPFGQEHSFQTVAGAAEILKESKARLDCKFTTGIEIVLQQETIRELPDLVDWAADNGIDYILTTHLIPYAEAQEKSCLFQPNPPSATRLIEKYKRKAAQQGLDLAESYVTYRRFAGTRSNSGALKLFNELQDEARKINLTLNIQTLLLHDGVNTEALEKFTAKAQKIAASRGISLHLPLSQALEQDERSCAFMRDRAVFIAANGDVMPCHFLWHTYSCRVNRDTIQVLARPFGNLRSGSLSAIWQSMEFDDFRAEASGADYSPCWSCPMAPCSPLVNDNLSMVNDCFGSTVPCSHCHWNLGGFHCL